MSHPNPAEYRLSAYQFWILDTLARGSVDTRTAQGWDQRPLKALYDRRLCHIDAKLQFHITTKGFNAWEWWMRNTPKTRLHQKPIKFGRLLRMPHVRRNRRVA